MTRPGPRRMRLAGAVVGLVLMASNANADGVSETAWKVLEKRCVGCHDVAHRKGGLSLATRDAALEGGDSGPAIEPKEPEASLLVELISGERPVMPRAGPALSGEDRKALAQWIDAGADWPKDRELEDRADAKQSGPWWAIQELRLPEIPTVQDVAWARTPIDRFILAKLDPKNLAPRAEADRRMLIRRLSFDLLGLPPLPEEIDAFMRDGRPGAYERLVDRLLASPAYGERWGRHWLDIAHYADTHGYDKDKRRDHAWPYRDYVIQALNADIPYGRYMEEQLAGDVLAPGSARGKIATGFIAAGPWDFVGHVELAEGTVEKAKTRVLDRDDMVATTMGAFTSLTVHCARCHDHKFDPITQREYYALQAVFAGVDRGDRVFDDRGTAAVRAELARKRADVDERLKGAPANSEEKEHLTRERAELDRAIKEAPVGDQVFAANPVAVRAISVLDRGDVEQPREAVGPGALSCVTGLASTFPTGDSEGERRAALARWLSDPANVLVWRSIANRVWHYHFGRGMVDTPSDFGRMGGTPSHPALLDWLAITVRDGDGSLKRLHRTIVTSAVYRQDSGHDEAAAREDGDNRLLWRQNRRRLEAEEIRDAILAVSGRLDRRMGGPGYDLFRFKDDHSPIYDHDDPAWADRPDGRRRAVYRFVVRSVPNPLLECLDGADANAPVPSRSETLTALQALALQNDRFILAESRAFADQVGRECEDLRERIAIVFRRALGRAPTAPESEALAEYARTVSLAATCRLVFNLNEFIFID
jgi:mono/diheme cytochrome c family protein